MDQAISRFPAEYLREFTAAVFKRFGVPAPDAALAADVLVKSDLRGVDSHGVARLHTYFEMLELGRINPHPNIKIIREKASVATVDGDNGLGLVVARKRTKLPWKRPSSTAPVGSAYATPTTSGLPDTTR